MIVQLPSNGLYGLRQVSLSMPKVGHLREVSSASYTEEQVRTEFVRLLVDGSGALFDKMTLYDRDYLFAIAASAVCMNRIAVDFVCPHCKAMGKDVRCSTVYDISEMEVKMLAEGTPVNVEKSWGDFVVRYHIPCVSDEECIVAYALADYEHYVERYERAFMACIFGQDISTPQAIDASIAVVDSYPLYVYFSGMLFNQMLFHGVPSTCEGVCSVCGQSSRVIVPFGQAVTEMDSGRLINRFSQLTGVLSFSDFLDLSMPELGQLEANLQARR